MPLRVYTQFAEYFEDYRVFLYLLFLLTRLRPVILKSSPDSPTGPAVLPPAVAAYLVDSLRLAPNLIARLWTALRPFLPDLVETNYSRDVDDFFRVHGRTHALGKSSPLAY